MVFIPVFSTTTQLTIVLKHHLLYVINNYVWKYRLQLDILFSTSFLQKVIFSFIDLPFLFDLIQSKVKACNTRTPFFFLYHLAKRLRNETLSQPMRLSNWDSSIEYIFINLFLWLLYNNGDSSTSILIFIIYLYLRVMHAFIISRRHRAERYYVLISRTMYNVLNIKIALK